jgi:hypothetical protein
LIASRANSLHDSRSAIKQFNSMNVQIAEDERGAGGVEQKSDRGPDEIR